MDIVPAAFSGQGDNGAERRMDDMVQGQAVAGVIDQGKQRKESLVWRCIIQRDATLTADFQSRLA